ncbi:hypothetical protein F385_2068 [Pantoea agglomerans 299R]|nr:hypothetical protein F385_2068 [Pantoea agglomerans 299R]
MWALHLKFRSHFKTPFPIHATLKILLGKSFSFLQLNIFLRLIS